MDIRPAFLTACNLINDQLASFDFKVSGKGQTLKRATADKDIFMEISFQSSSLNDPANIKLLVHIYIYSKKLKKWLAEITANPNTSGLIFGTQLGYLTPLKTWKAWNVAGNNGQKSSEEIASLIATYVMPIFERFENPQETIDFLAAHGTTFNAYTEKSLQPMAFMLYYGEKEKAQDFFCNYISDCNQKRNILELYQELRNGKPVDYMGSEFIDAFHVKLAYVYGLKAGV